MSIVQLNQIRSLRVDALSRIRTWNDIKQLIIENKGSLDYLSEYEGLDNFLGSGTYGKVFKIKGENLTIKVTTDTDEIDGSLLVYRKGPGRRFINVYSIQIITYNLAIKIQDYLYPLTGKNIEAADQLNKLFDYGFELPKRNSNFEYMPYYEDLNINAQNFLKELYKDFEKFDLVGLDFGNLDVKKDNLLQDRQGNLILADF